MQKTLFDPVRIGRLNLANRIIMAPMTRSRASTEGVPNPLAPLYYEQRASAGMIISEATAICKQGSGYPSIPGMWTDDQETAWRKITESVHRKNGKIVIQLYHTGRISHSSLIGETPVSASSVKPEGEVMTASLTSAPYELPRPLEPHEIATIVNQFAAAAKRAISAGADGVEIHAANGYLIDQFLRDGTNRRKDEYGGQVKSRARFLMEVTQAVSDAIGSDRVGVRLSPENSFNEMSDSDPIQTFTEIARMLKGRGLAYLHIIESFIETGGERTLHPLSESMAREFQGPIILNRGYNYDSATKILQSELVSVIAFGIPFIGNPDLVERFRNKVPLNPADSTKFYGGGEGGYTDYPSVYAN